MLKYVLAFFAFILVTLAPVSADEGYIPYFPDFMEPDGIGFRGPAEHYNQACWSQNSVEEACGYDAPRKGIISKSYGHTLSSPITFEYRQKYIFKNLFFNQNFADINFSLSDARIGGVRNDLSNSYVDSDTFLSGFLTTEEKSIMSNVDDSNIFNLETRSNTLLFGTALGIDLWFFEISIGPFLMYHDTKVNLRTCRGNTNIEQIDSRYKPSSCQLYPDDVINLGEQQFSGFAYGWRDEMAIVFLETENWRIWTGGSNTNILQILDSNFKPVKFRELNYNAIYSVSPQLECDPYQIETYDKSTNQRKYRDVDCKNSKGEDFSASSDWTGFFQITYYFR